MTEEDQDAEVEAKNEGEDLVPIYFECCICGEAKEPEEFETDDETIHQNDSGQFICLECFEGLEEDSDEYN